MVDTVTVESFIPATRISQPQQCALIVDSVYSVVVVVTLAGGEMSLCAPCAAQQPGRATTGDCAGTAGLSWAGGVLRCGPGLES